MADSGVSNRQPLAVTKKGVLQVSWATFLACHVTHNIQILPLTKRRAVLIPSFLLQSHM